MLYQLLRLRVRLTYLGIPRSSILTSSPLLLLYYNLPISGSNEEDNPILGTHSVIPRCRVSGPNVSDDWSGDGVSGAVLERLCYLSRNDVGQFSSLSIFSVKTFMTILFTNIHPLVLLYKLACRNKKIVFRAPPVC